MLFHTEYRKGEPPLVTRRLTEPTDVSSFNIDNTRCSRHVEVVPESIGLLDFSTSLKTTCWGWFALPIKESGISEVSKSLLVLVVRSVPQSDSHCQTISVHSESCQCESDCVFDPSTLIHRDETTNFYDPLHMQRLRGTPLRHQFLPHSHERLPHHISCLSLSWGGRSCDDGRVWFVLPCCALSLGERTGFGSNESARTYYQTSSSCPVCSWLRCAHSSSAPAQRHFA